MIMKRTYTICKEVMKAESEKNAEAPPICCFPNENTCAELLFSGKPLYVLELEEDGDFTIIETHELNAEKLAKGFASFIKRSVNNQEAGKSFTVLNLSMAIL